MRVFSVTLWAMILTSSTWGQTTVPATQLADFQARVNAAQELVSKRVAAADQQKNGCLERFHASAEYRMLEADRDRKANRLNELRKTGPMSERITASGEFVKANETLKKIEASYLASDPALQAAIASLAVARKNLQDADDALRAKENAEAVSRTNYIDALKAGRVDKGTPVADVVEAWGNPEIEERREDGTVSLVWRKYVDLPIEPGRYVGVVVPQGTFTQGGSQSETPQPDKRLSAQLEVVAKEGRVIQSSARSFQK